MLQIIEKTCFARKTSNGFVVTARFGLLQCGPVQHHAWLCCGTERYPVMMYFGPSDKKKVFLVKASGRRYRVVRKICVLIGALLQDACGGDEVLTDGRFNVK